MKHEKLMRAMSEIDEDLILEAHEERRVLPLWIRYGAIAACLLLVVLIVPQVMQNGGMDFLPTAKDEVEMDAATNMGGLAPSESFKDNMESPSYSLEDNEEKDGFFEEPEEVSRAEIIKLALQEQGKAYSCDEVVENEYGKVMFTNRSKSTVTMKVTLLKDLDLSVFSATSGVWRLTVNGETAEEFPDKAGVYEIIVDFSGDKSLDMIYVVDFGVFSLTLSKEETR